MNLDEISVLIKSIVVSSKNGVLFKDIDREFQEEAGCRIPYKSFKHDSLDSFLSSIDGVRLVKNSYGETTIKVQTENSKHIQELVREQRSSDKRRKRGKRSKGGKENIRRPAFSTRRSNFQNAPKPKLSVKPTVNDVNKVPPKKVSPLSAPRYVNQRTTQDATRDVRGLPFVNTAPSIKAPPTQKILNQATTQNSSQDIRGLPLVVVSSNNNQINEEGSTGTSSSYETTDEECASNEFTPLKITIGRGNRRVEEVPKSDQKIEYPSTAGYCLFGDDYFYNYLKEKIGLIKVEMCGKGLTVKDALKLFQKEIIYPRKMIMLLGGTDLLIGKSVEDVAQDYYTLINKMNVIQTLKICTIPLFIDKRNDRKFFNDIAVMNELIKSVPEDLDEEIEVIDLYGEFLKMSRSFNVDVSSYFTDDYNFNCEGLSLLGTILKKYSER